jgi:hypothetical protein
MFSYRCLSCGASAYSSANAATVGVCPTCERPLEKIVPEPPAPRSEGRPPVTVLTGLPR